MTYRIRSQRAERSRPFLGLRGEVRQERYTWERYFRRRDTFEVVEEKLVDLESTFEESSENDPEPFL